MTRIDAAEIRTIEETALAFPGVTGVNVRIDVLDTRPGQERETIREIEYTGTADRVALACVLEAKLDRPTGCPVQVVPIPTILQCPKCGLTHIDTAEWTTKPHRTHLCNPEDGGCGHAWRPYDYPTIGVPELKRWAGTVMPPVPSGRWTSAPNRANAPRPSWSILDIRALLRGLNRFGRRYHTLTVFADNVGELPPEPINGIDISVIGRGVVQVRRLAPDESGGLPTVDELEDARETAQQTKGTRLDAVPGLLSRAGGLIFPMQYEDDDWIAFAGGLLSWLKEALAVDIPDISTAPEPHTGTRPYTSEERRRLSRLAKRCAFLQRRIDGTPGRDLSHDKAEVSALHWILGQVLGEDIATVLIAQANEDTSGHADTALPAVRRKP